MPDYGRRFSSDEVSAIVRRALADRAQNDTVSYEELEEIARQSGVSPDRLQSVIEEQERYGEIEDARELWRKRRKQKFFEHLRAYCIVNGVLMLMNLVSSPGELWFIWPVLGWGIGLAFDASEAFWSKESAVERGAERILARKRKHQRRAEAALDRM